VSHDPSEITLIWWFAAQETIMKTDFGGRLKKGMKLILLFRKDALNW